MNLIGKIITATLFLGAACAAKRPPPELASARTAYTRASFSKASTLAPAELHKAKAALDTAERSFEASDNSQATRDLAYVAERRAELAEALAESAQAEGQETAANQ